MLVYWLFRVKRVPPHRTQPLQGLRQRQGTLTPSTVPLPQRVFRYTDLCQWKAGGITDRRRVLGGQQIVEGRNKFFFNARGSDLSYYPVLVNITANPQFPTVRKPEVTGKLIQ